MPRINSYISVTGIVQDELGHAHIAYRLLRDLGVDVEAVVYERDPKDFRHPYAFDVPLDCWAEMVVANAFYDRAGFCLLDDVFQHSSYGPWKRALVKVELMAHPAVREAAVIAKPDERWSERPLACVVLQEGRPADPGDLAAFLRGRVARWWVPDEFAFLDEVPKTSVGKFDKRALRRQLAEDRLPARRLVAAGAEAPEPRVGRAQQ